MKRETLLTAYMDGLNDQVKFMKKCLEMGLTLEECIELTRGVVGKLKVEYGMDRGKRGGS